MKCFNELRGVLLLAAVMSWSVLAGCTEVEGGEPADESSLGQEAREVDPNPIPVPLPPPVTNRGMTWVKTGHDSTRGQDSVGCHDYVPGQVSCDPHVGDTDCSLARRILCIRQDGSSSNGFVGSFYNGWAAGNIGLTHPVVGSSLTSVAVANAQCVAEFGGGWRMAEFHDGGGGWRWTAYGNLNDVFLTGHASHTVNDRFWVHVNDQLGNCWN